MPEVVEDAPDEDDVERLSAEELRQLIYRPKDEFALEPTSVTERGEAEALRRRNVADHDARGAAGFADECGAAVRGSQIQHALAGQVLREPGAVYEPLDVVRPGFHDTRGQREALMPQERGLRDEAYGDIGIQAHGVTGVVTRLS